VLEKSKLAGKEEKKQKTSEIKSVVKIMEVSRPALLNFIKTRELATC